MYLGLFDFRERIPRNAPTPALQKKGRGFASEPPALAMALAIVEFQ